MASPESVSVSLNMVAMCPTRFPSDGVPILWSKQSGISVDLDDFVRDSIFIRELIYF